MTTSSILLRRLENDRGLSRANARKVLQRDFVSANGVWRSEELRLEGGGRLYAYKSFYRDAPFLDAIRPLLIEQRRGIARVLSAIEKFDAIDIADIAKLTAADFKYEDFSLSSEHLVIEEAGLGVFESSGTGRNRLVRVKYAKTPESDALGFQLLGEREAERKWVGILLRHLSQQNLVSWRSFEDRYSTVFNKRLFSAVGYSYVRPLVRFDRGKKEPIACPVVVDVLTRNAELFDIEGFVERMHRAGANAQAGLRIMGVFGAPYFTPEAFELARKKGLLIVSFGEVFGPATISLVNSAQSLFSEMEKAEQNGTNPKGLSELAVKIADSIKDLKNHPLVTDLSGLAFESFAAAVVRARSYEEVRAGDKVPFFDGRGERVRDVDIHGHIDQDWLVIECKALNEKRELEAHDVRKFFTETLPGFVKYTGKKNMKKCRAELWTTGIVTQNIRDYLENELSTLKGVEVKILSREEIEVPSTLKPLARMLKVLAAI